MAHLHAVSIVVPDYDAAIVFYCGVLGFDLIDDIDQGRKRWVRVRPPGAKGDAASLILARADTDRQRAAIGDQFGGRVGLFLASDDFARDHARMKAQGVRFEEAPRHETYGTVAVWRDPFGNRWDLIQFARP